MERRERWLSLAIFFSFYRINFRGSCDSCESQLPLFWTIYFPTAPLFLLLHNNKSADPSQICALSFLSFICFLSSTVYAGFSRRCPQLCCTGLLRLFPHFHHTFLPIESYPIFQDLLIPLLPQRFLILLLFDLPQRLIAFFFQPLITL